MTLVFEDAEQFERGALRAGLGGGALGFVAGALGGTGLLAWHAGLATTTGGVRVLDAIELGLAVMAAAVTLGLGVARRARAREAGESVPSRGLLAVAVVLAALGGVLAPRGLPVFAADLFEWLQEFALTRWMPGALALALVLALCGAVCGLWAGVAAALVHLSRGGEVEERLRALRGQLSGEPRSLAERAAAAQREAVGLLVVRGGHGGPLVRAPAMAIGRGRDGAVGRARRVHARQRSGHDDRLCQRRHARRRARRGQPVGEVAPDPPRAAGVAGHAPLGAAR